MNIAEYRKQRLATLAVASAIMLLLAG